MPSASAHTLDTSVILYRAVTSVAQALAMAGLGLVFARAKVIDAQSRKVLSTISMKITIPCLLFASLLTCPQELETEKANDCPDLLKTISSAWPVLLLPLLWVSLGLLCGRVAAFLGGAPVALRGTAVAACAFPNSTGLPITLLSALSTGLPITGSDSSGRQLHKCLLLLSIYQILYPVLQWSLGSWLLAKAPDEAALLECGEPQPAPSLKRRCKAFMRAFLVPPVVGVLCGFALAIFPQVRLFLVDTKIPRDNDSPLEWLFNAIETFGKAAVPLNMLVLGASLANVPNLASVNWRLTLSVAFSKLVLHPAAGFGVIFSLYSTGLIEVMVGSEAMQPDFVIVACLLAATPTANNLAVMAEVGGGAEAKQALAAMIFVMYCIAPILLTAWIVAFVSLAQLQI